MPRVFENCSDCLHFKECYIAPQEGIAQSIRDGASNTSEFAMRAGEFPVFVGDEDYAKSLRKAAERDFQKADNLEQSIALEAQVGNMGCDGPVKLGIGRFTLKSFCSTGFTGRNLVYYGLAKDPKYENKG